jgi:hypothetical protein
MPLRRLLTAPKIEILGKLGFGWNEAIAITISEDPPEFSDKNWRSSEYCPVCGASTVGAEQVPATLHLTFDNGSGLGLGVWVHRRCFEICPEAGRPTPVPW